MFLALFDHPYLQQARNANRAQTRGFATEAGAQAKSSVNRK